MVERRVARRRARKTREERRFARVDLGDRLSEVGASGGLDAVRAVAEVDLVQVHLEDSVLRVLPFELERQRGFLQLSVEALVGREEEQLGELLRDRAPALHDATAAVV